MPYHLAVDVGTTYTAAAIGRDGRVEPATLGTRSVAVPTVVCLVDGRMLVGEPAARRAVTDPHRVAREFKRRVGDPTPLLLGGTPVAAELCMARVVEWVVDQVAATEGEPPATLALTHPANWGEYKLDLLRQALRHVGLTVDLLVPEPVAAATEYAARHPRAHGTVAVYDLGGGTFDAALVEVAPAGARLVGRPDGVERLGGIDFDHAVFRHVLDSLGLDLDGLADDPRTAAGLAQLREECVEAKEALSHETDVSIPVMLPQRHTEVRLTRAELEAMIRPALEETIVALRRAVASADRTVDDLAAVLLVGGSSRIPLVGQLVGELGRPVAVDARPKDTISLGAVRAVMARRAGPAAAPPPAPRPAPSARGPAPAAPGATPAGDPPAAPAVAGHGRRRRLVAGVLGAVALVAAAVAAALALTDGDGGGSASGRSTTTTVGPTTAPAGPGTGTGDGTGTASAPRPLPGDDWNDEARARFVADCGTGIAAEAGPFVSDAEAVCGCIYDEVSTTTDFAAFNEQWAADDFDASGEVGAALTAAIFSCATAAAAGG